MLRLPPFKYIAPDTLKEAAEALAAYGDEAMLVAGGTDLYPNMKRRQFEPKVLVGLRRIEELRWITGDEKSGVVIGAGVTLREVSAHPIVSSHYHAVAKAAGLVSTPPLRNMGTIGGNLCVDTRCNYYNMPHPWRKAIGFCMKKDGDICLVAPGSSKCLAVSSSDLAPVVVALGARLRLVGTKEERVVPAGDFYRDDGISYLAKERDEILAEVRLPAADGWRTTYWKLRRRGSFDFPILGVAACLRLNDDGRVESLRLVLGAVASRPVEVEGAEAILADRRPSPEDIEAVAEAAYRVAKPMDNADGAFYWRKKMVRPYVRGALRELLGMDVA
ncbi:MAG: FAD binding domain-containing protein [Thermoplasmata archaeon]